VRILIEAADNAKNSLIEAAVDDLSVTSIVPPPTPLVQAGFNNGIDGFAFLPDAFRGTNQPAYSAGAWSGTAGVSGGGLQVSLGGLDNEIVQDISGGWSVSFNLASAATVNVQYWYKLTQSSEYEAEECSQVLVSLDGTLHGAGSNDYVTQICGNGNGGSNETSGWQLFSFELPLAAGSHILVVGGYNNQKSWDNEWTEVLIDEVLVEAR
jgi:hypothetical protein